MKAQYIRADTGGGVVAVEFPSDSVATVQSGDLGGGLSVALGGRDAHLSVVESVDIQFHPQRGGGVHPCRHVGLPAEIQVAEQGGVSVSDLGEHQILIGGLVPGDTNVTAQLTGQVGGDMGGGWDGLPHSRGGLDDLGDRAVLVDMDGLGTNVARVDGAVGGTMVENIPLSLEAFHGAVVVPDRGVTARIVDDDAAVLEVLHGMIRHGVTQAGGAAFAADGIAVAVGIGKEEVVLAVDLLDRASLVELMVGNRQRIHYGIGLDFHHVLFQLCDLAPGELTPVDVGLAVVVHQDGGVDAPDTLNLPHIGEGSHGGLGLGHTAPSVGDTVVEVVPAVAVGTVGGIEGAAILRPGGIG